MRKALVLTIGTEITCGEIVNSNAAWVSQRLEEVGIRVFAHISVRDQANEIARALNVAESGAYDPVIVTGGLGPTTDDITRTCLAEFAGVPIEMDEDIWQALAEAHRKRGFATRESHRHQCEFPKGSERLNNPVGTALGFRQVIRGTTYFVLPGPPRELEGMWVEEVAPRLKDFVEDENFRWLHWTCLGKPESEIADLAEVAIEGTGLEIGYRAQVPYVKVKIFVDPDRDAAVVRRLDHALDPFVIMRGGHDLAELVVKNWPEPHLDLLDGVTHSRLAVRLLSAKSKLASEGVNVPEVTLRERGPLPTSGLCVTETEGKPIATYLNPTLGSVPVREELRLPYGLKVDTERGRRTAAEYVLWFMVRKMNIPSPPLVPGPP